MDALSSIDGKCLNFRAQRATYAMHVGIVVFFLAFTCACSAEQDSNPDILVSWSEIESILEDAVVARRFSEFDTGFLRMLKRTVEHHLGEESGTVVREMSVKHDSPMIQLAAYAYHMDSPVTDRIELALTILLNSASPLSPFFEQITTDVHGWSRDEDIFAQRFARQFNRTHARPENLAVLCSLVHANTIAAIYSSGLAVDFLPSNEYLLIERAWEEDLLDSQELAEAITVRASALRLVPGRPRLVYTLYFAEETEIQIFIDNLLSDPDLDELAVSVLTRRFPDGVRTSLEGDVAVDPQRASQIRSLLAEE